MKDRLSTPIRLLVGVLILAVVISNLNWRDLAYIISTIDIIPLALSLGVLAPLLLLKGWRWYLLLVLQQAQYKFSLVMLDFLSGNYVGLVTPGRAGELIRVIYQKQASGVNYGKALSNVLVDRLLDLSVALVVAMLGFFIYQPTLPSEVFVAIAGFLLIGLVFVGGWMVVKHKGLRFQTKDFVPTNILTRFYRRLADQTTGWPTFQSDFYNGLRQLMQWRVFFPTSVSVLAFLFTVLQISLLARSLHLDLSLSYLAFCLTITNLVSLLPISISGLGVRDATFILLLSEVGISPEAALSLSLLFLFAFNLAGVVLGAVAWYLRPGWTKSLSQVDSRTGDVLSR